MSKVLRHTAKNIGLEIDKGGWVLLADLLNLKEFRGMTRKDIQNIVYSNNKKRFELKRERGVFKIRAVQGHSMSHLEDSLLFSPLNVEEFKDKPIIHGTFRDAWKFIQETGLKKMARNHIHFAIGYPGDQEVISGMRNTCEIFIEIDLELAVRNGIKFFISQNKVVLSKGINGAISPLFFKRVYEATPSGKQLVFSNEKMEELKKIHTYRNILVLDFECNNEEKVKLEPMEVIEFPVVVLNGATNQLEPSRNFHQYIKPTIHPQLTEFITSLTGITQEQVDKGVTLKSAIERFNLWYQEQKFVDEETCIVTHGNFDLQHLRRESEMKGIILPDILKRFINLNDPFKIVNNIHKTQGMVGLLKHYGLELIGRHHSGIDDANNIARVF